MAGQQKKVVEVEEDSSLSDDLASVIDELEGPEEDAPSAEPSETAAPEETQTEVSEEAQAPAETAPAETAQADTRSPYKPPIDWSPKLKEEFKKLPDTVRRAIHENEVSRAQLMQSTAQDRRVAQSLRQVIEPYRAMMAAEGVQDPLAGIQGLLTTTAQLAFGSPAQKANKIAGLIKHYGVDIETLDSILAGQLPPQGQPAPPPSDPRVEAIWQHLQQQQAQQAQHVQTRAATSIHEFGSNPRNEFFDSVRYIMADFLDVAAKNGQHMTLEDAYHRACAAHPEVSEIIAQRWGQQRSATTRTTAQRKAAAASSIAGKRSAGSDPANSEARSIREILEEKIPASPRI